MNISLWKATDNNGCSLHKPDGARPITTDGRLLWVGPVQQHQYHEFFLDGVNLGSITLEQAMKEYK